MIFHTLLHWLKQNIKQYFDPQKTLHSSTSRASYGVSIVRIWGKNDRVIAALHCIIWKKLSTTVRESILWMLMAWCCSIKGLAGIWLINSSDAGDGTFLLLGVNTMPADALALKSPIIKVIKDIITFWIVSWIWLNPSRWNQLWNNNACCLSCTANNIPADVLATLGARASAGMVLTPKAGIVIPTLAPEEWLPTFMGNPQQRQIAQLMSRFLYQIMPHIWYIQYMSPTSLIVLFCKISNTSHTKSQNLMFLISFCSCLCTIHWSQVLSRKWRCSWSSANRRCSNYIWVINNFYCLL